MVSLMSQPSWPLNGPCLKRGSGLRQIQFCRLDKGSRCLPLMPSSISAAHPSSSTTNTHSAYLANCRLVSTRSHLSKCIRRGLDHLQSKCLASALFLSSAMQTRHLIRPPPTTTAIINIAGMKKESLQHFLKYQEKTISNREICSNLIHLKVSGLPIKYTNTSSNFFPPAIS